MTQRPAPAATNIGERINISVGRALLDRERRYVEIDEVMAAMHGLPREEHLGRTVDEVLPDLAPAINSLVVQVLRTGEPLVNILVQGETTATEGERRRWLASYYPVRSRGGTIVGVDVEVRAASAPAPPPDVAALVEQDAAFALLDTVFAHAPTGLACLDRDYRYVRINQALAALHGASVEAHLGRTIREVLPGLAPLVEPILARVLATGEAAVDIEIAEEREPAAGGRRVWRASYYPIRVAGGEIAGFGVVANDITVGRRAAEALRLSEERFRIALQSAQIIVYTTDRDLRYTWINNPHPDFAVDEVLGRRDEELLPAEEAAKLTALKRRVLDTETGTRQEVALRIGAEVVHYDMTVEPLRYPGGAVTGLTVAAVDITRRLAAEAALRASEARAALLTEAVPAILYTAAPDGSTIYLSQGYYAYTGAALGSGEGAGWAEAVHPDDLPELNARWKAAAASGTPFEAEYRIRGADGAYRWFRGRSQPVRDGCGAIVNWFGLSLDIEDAKRAEAEREALLLREQEARARAERTATQLAQLQDVAAALAQALTPAEVAHTVAQRSAATLGASSSTVRVINVAKNTLEILTSIGMPEAVTDRWRAVPLSAPLPIVEVVRSGAAFFFESREELRPWAEELGATVERLGYEAFVVVPLLVEGRTIGSLALTFDTPRAFDGEDRSFVLALAGQCAQALERARLLAAAQAAVEVRDSFIAVASHDLRTPITALLGQAQLLERRAAGEGFSERTTRTVRTIVQAAGRLSRMVTALLDLSHIQMGQIAIEPAPLDLSPFVRRIVDDLQPTLGEHRLLVEGDAAPALVAADELRLEQVLHNLIGNAVKYSPAGSAVRLRLERAEGQVRLQIADKGMGIPGEALPRLFERFYRAPGAANRTISGLGVGLYVVREIVALHGGTVSVASAEGAGSTFTVTLPAL